MADKGAKPAGRAGMNQVEVSLKIKTKLRSTNHVLSNRSTLVGLRHAARKARAVFWKKTLISTQRTVSTQIILQLDFSVHRLLACKRGRWRKQSRYRNVSLLFLQSLVIAITQKPTQVDPRIDTTKKGAAGTEDAEEELKVLQAKLDSLKRQPKKKFNYP